MLEALWACLYDAFDGDFVQSDLKDFTNTSECRYHKRLGFGVWRDEPWDIKDLHEFVAESLANVIIDKYREVAAFVQAANAIDAQALQRNVPAD